MYVKFQPVVSTAPFSSRKKSTVPARYGQRGAVHSISAATCSVSSKSAGRRVLAVTTSPDVGSSHEQVMLLTRGMRPPRMERTTPPLAGENSGECDSSTICALAPRPSASSSTEAPTRADAGAIPLSSARRGV